MKVAISFLCTEFNILRDHWKKHKALKQHEGTDVGLGGVFPNQQGVEPFIGGKVIIIDWPSHEVLWEMDVDGAAGFVIDNEILTICNMRLHYISQINIKEKTEMRKINNTSFNCLHSLAKTPQDI